jgi:hypothetical membrane protein
MKNAQANEIASSMSFGQNRRAGALLLSSGIIFTIFNTIAESIYPNYNIGTNALSDLGAIGQPTAILWDGQLFVSGLVTLLGMWILVFKSSFAPKISFPAKILFLLTGIGTIMVSLFPENTIIALHDTGALVSFLAGGLSSIYSYKFTKSPFRFFVLLLGLATLLAIPLLGSHPIVGFGGTERLIVYPTIIWGTAIGGYLMAY